jgi:hypothetical protein
MISAKANQPLGRHRCYWCGRRVLGCWTGIDGWPRKRVWMCRDQRAGRDCWDLAARKTISKRPKSPI